MIATEPPWWDVFGLQREAATVDAVEAVYKAMARRAHPDNGGTDAAMARINSARDRALQELKT